MPGTKRTVTIQQHTDSLQINYNEEKHEFEITFKPGIEPLIPGAEDIEICLALKEETVRQMVDSLPPLEPESVH